MSPTPPPRAWAPWLERAVLGALVVLFVWRALAPAWRTLNTDFPNYYLGARLLRDGYPLERFYDWVWFQRQKDHAGIVDQPLVGFIPLSFFSAVVVAPLASLPPLEAKHGWIVVSGLVLLGTAWLLQRMTSLGRVRVLLIVFLAVVPLRTSFQFGQQHLLLLFLLTLAAWLDAIERPFASGSMLAVASSLKLYPALFVFFLVRKRKWRALAGLVVTGVFLALVAWRLFGFEPMRVYVSEILPRGMRGENNDPYAVGHNSPTTLLLRLFVREPELNPQPLLDAPLVFAVLQPIVQALILVPGLWLMSPGGKSRAREMLDWAAYVALLLVLSSASATYHFCVLILATVVTTGYLLERGEKKLASTLIALHAAVCAPLYRFVPDSPSGWAIFAGFPRLYALLALWGVILWVLRRARAESPPRRGSGEARAFGLLFAALAATGLIANVRHLHGQAASYLARLDRKNKTLLATSPSVAGDAVYFARMDEGGSVLDRTGSDLRIHTTPGTEIFHPAVTEASADGWLELSSTTSRILRFPLAATELAAASLAIEVDDAEQPTISRDGRWLAFLREDGHGRGVLHLKDRQADPPGGREEEVAGAPRDVLDIGFLPDDRIVLAAVRDGRSRLFVGPPADGAFVEIATLRSPGALPRFVAGRPLARLQSGGARRVAAMADDAGRRRGATSHERRLQRHRARVVSGLEEDRLCHRLRAGPPAHGTVHDDHRALARPLSPRGRGSGS